MGTIIPSQSPKQLTSNLNSEQCAVGSLLCLDQWFYECSSWTSSTWELDRNVPSSASPQTCRIRNSREVELGNQYFHELLGCYWCTAEIWEPLAWGMIWGIKDWYSFHALGSSCLSCILCQGEMSLSFLEAKFLYDLISLCMCHSYSLHCSKLDLRWLTKASEVILSRWSFSPVLLPLGYLCRGDRVLRRGQWRALYPFSPFYHPILYSTGAALHVLFMSQKTPCWRRLGKVWSHWFTELENVRTRRGLQEHVSKALILQRTLRLKEVTHKVTRLMCGSQY